MRKKLNIFEYTSNVPVNYFQILGAGLLMLFSLYLGQALDYQHLGTLSSFGIFTYFYYRRMPLKNLIKMMTILGLSMTVAFSLSLIGSIIPWLAPIILGLIAFLSRFLLRLYELSKPGPIFFMLVSTTAVAFKAVTWENHLLYTGYFVVGVVAAIIMALIIHFLEKGTIYPLHDRRSYTERLEDDPGSLLEAYLYGGITFLVVYVAQGLDLYNPAWMVFSTTTILQGNTVESMLNRNIQRILGTSVGLLIAFAMMTISMPFWMRALLIVLMMVFFEYFTPRNYAIALSFVTPMVILTSTLANPNYILDDLISGRLIGIIYGSIFGVIGGWVMVTLLRFYDQQFSTQIEDFSEEEARLDLIDAYWRHLAEEEAIK